MGDAFQCRVRPTPLVSGRMSPSGPKSGFWRAIVVLAISCGVAAPTAARALPMRFDLVCRSSDVYSKVEVVDRISIDTVRGWFVAQDRRTFGRIKRAGYTSVVLRDHDDPRHPDYAIVRDLGAGGVTLEWNAPGQNSSVRGDCVAKPFTNFSDYVERGVQPGRQSHR